MPGDKPRMPFNDQCSVIGAPREFLFSFTVCRGPLLSSAGQPLRLYQRLKAGREELRAAHGDAVTLRCTGDE